LADLQRLIQITMGWSDEYQHRFCIRNHYLGASGPGGLLLFGDPDELKLSQFASRLHERFTYEYNFFDGGLLDIRLEGEQPLDSPRNYPRCVAGARRAPPQDSGGTELFMDRQPCELLQARKAWRVDRTLRRLADLPEDPTLDDGAFRERSRVILRERQTPEFSGQPPVRQKAAGAMGAADRAPAPPTAHPDAQWHAA